MPTIAEIAYEWLASTDAAIAPTSYDKYKRDIERFVVPMVGEIEIEDFANRDLQKFINDMATRPQMKSTKKKPLYYSQAVIGATFETLKLIHRYAARMGYCAPIIYSVTIPRASDYYKSGKIKFLGEPDAVKFTARLCEIVIDPTTLHKGDDAPLGSRAAVRLDYNRRYALGCLLGIGCGTRIGEACGVIPSTDFDYSSSALDIQRAVRSYKHKATSKYITEVGPTKTPKSTRRIPQPQPHAELFKEYGPKSGYLIPGGHNRKDIPSRRGLESWFKRLAIAEGHSDITFHALRHTYATRLLDAGVDIKTISELLGHASEATTIRIYIHPDERSKAAAVNKVAW